MTSLRCFSAMFFPLWQNMPGFEPPSRTAHGCWHKNIYWTSVKQLFPLTAFLQITSTLKFIYANINMWPVKVCVCVGYGNLEESRASLPGKDNLARTKKILPKKATVHKSAVSLSAFYTNLQCWAVLRAQLERSSLKLRDGLGDSLREDQIR